MEKHITFMDWKMADTVKMLMVPRMICRFKAISTKFPAFKKIHWLFTFGDAKKNKYRKTILKEKKWLEDSTVWLQVLLQSYSTQDNVVVA